MNIKYPIAAAGITVATFLPHYPPHLHIDDGLSGIVMMAHMTMTIYAVAPNTDGNHSSFKVVYSETLQD